ncbi:mfs general substrate transporter [Diplodia corticola]|uniref:Mfs general substrate transporter n=1 Tax=Diplodia corticola TaxID=236234 RepID=A0A1J9RQU2_9PEZI|nr:mfs general substrate transporter [Diplodia corticola]OJD29917.1 mfs general substrate transporter [Diplodia corticola]
MTTISFQVAEPGPPTDASQDARRTTPGPPSSAAPSLFDSDPEKGGSTRLDRATSGQPSQQAEIEEGNWPTEWRAWTTLCACFFLMFNSWGLVNAYGTFSSYYKDVLLPDTDALYFNLIGATECFMVLILSGVVGRLLDAGLYKYLLGTGTFLITLGFMMLSISNGNGEWKQGSFANIEATHGIVAGLGMACFFVSSSQIAATWFHRRKSLAIGIVASGASISGLVYPIMLRFLTTSIGFNNAVRCVAGLIGITALFSFFFATPNPKHIHHSPGSWMDHRAWVDFEAFQYKPFNWFTASIAFLFLGFYPVFFNLEEWAAYKGFGYKAGIGRTSGPGEHRPLTAGLATYYMLAIMNAMSTFGRVGAAWLSDHFGAVRVHTIATGVSSLLLLLLWTLAPNFDVAMVFVAFFGVFSGSVIGLPPASMANLLGKDPRRQAKLGQWTGMMYTFAGIPALVGPIIAGHLISEYKTYITVQLWSGACLMVSAVCMGIATMYKHREEPDMVTSDQSDSTDQDEDCRTNNPTIRSNASSRTVSSGVSTVDRRRDEQQNEKSDDEAKKAKDDERA